jgi:nucleoside-diphosphate-sugar epimerase
MGRRRAVAKILITGGTGFVGENINIYRPAYKWPYFADSLTRLAQSDYIQGWDLLEWSAIIHLAPVEPSRAIACAKRNNCPLLFASSGAVYYDTPNQYGKDKIEWEKQILDSGVDCRIARIFTTCGAHMKWDNFAIGNFIWDAVNVGYITVKGSGQIVRSYMHGEDLARYLWTILLKGEPGGIYDVGSFHPVTIAQLANEVAHNFDPIRKVFVENSIKHEQAPVYLPKTRPGLDLHITIPFEEAVRRTVQSFLEEHE